MNSQEMMKPSICIDLKKKRIRIHKATLHQMGDPEYIQLLVHPEKQSLVIRICLETDKFSQRVRLYPVKSDYCYELYCTGLLKEMKSVTVGWKDKRSFRIYGMFNRAQNAALFGLKDIELI